MIALRPACQHASRLPDFGRDRINAIGNRGIIRTGEAVG